MPTQPRSILPILLATLCFPAGSARAEVLVVFPSRDNTLYESETGASSNGAGSWFFSGQNNGLELRRGVLAFDLRGIEPGAFIQEATLVLFMDKTFTTTARTIRLHRLLSDWGEGTTDAGFNEGGGAPSTPGSATWIHTFHPGSFWSAPGGDFSATVSAETDVGAAELPYSWSGPGLVADVQEWVDDPASNFGWILIGNEAVLGTAKRFRAREYPDSLTIPRLTLTYLSDPVSAPPDLEVGSWGRIKNLYRHSFR
jgi:hypothetical protein